MNSRCAGIASLTLAIVGGHAAVAWTQDRAPVWLDETKPASWNTRAAAVPDAPKLQGNSDSRCGEAARPPESEADRRVRGRGWQLVGAYEGGWEIVVIRGTAGYDGMCRPRGYQDFVFVRGTFAGTLSPQPMDSRTDGALSQVFIQGRNLLAAEYLRYAPSDPLCCPSGTTSVVFEIDPATLLLRPISASTSPRTVR
jgi:hypothetical protein